MQLQGYIAIYKLSNKMSNKNSPSLVNTVLGKHNYKKTTTKSAEAFL